MEESKSENIIEKNISINEIPLTQCQSDYRNHLEHNEKNISKPATFLLVTSIFFILSFSVYCIFSRAFNLQNSFYSSENNTTVTLGLNNKPLSEEISVDSNGKYTVTGIVDSVSPSVVEILIFSDITRSSAVGNGSGIIMSEDGYIVTNAHVVTSGESLSVRLHDESIYEAHIIGYDSKTDIAVIKLDKEDLLLTPAVFGNSDEVVKGEQVVTIGNPGGLSGSISVGYVSGINRKIRGDQTSKEMTCIQTDAAISPGNSGGALVNMYGQIIGITSSKYVNSYYEGLGFAITINEAKPIIEELVANGYISGRFRVGITFYAVTKALAEQENIPRGLKIETIDENCDIANSGLKPGDIITETEGRKVFDYDTFMEAIEKSGKGAGDTVKAKAERKKDDDSFETIEIEFALMPDTSGNY